VKTKNPIVTRTKVENINLQLIEEYFKKQIQLQIGDIETKLSEHQ